MGNSSHGVRSGRRPGSPETRATILAAARQEFAERAYEGATIRAIATRAGVDPALALHYFGSKRELFLAALELPFDPARIAEAALAGDPKTTGERLLHGVLTAWDDTVSSSPMIALIRSAMADESVVRMLREYLQRVLIAPVAVRTGRPDADTRAALLAAQMVGLVVIRYIVRLEPLASMRRERVVALLAPQVQRLLTEDLPEAKTEDAR